MQTKNYNSYSIIHRNGETEKLNAETMEQALANMTVKESESPVSRALLTQSQIKTLIADEPEIISFTAVVDSASVGGGSIATPASGTVHEGDVIQLQAIPARTYQFVSWKRNDKVISTEAVLDYTMTSLEEGEESVVFTATFELSPVAWTTQVSPEEASGAGCIAFPTSGTTAANASGEFLAVAETGYAFDHWERNGETLSSNRLMQLEHISPLAISESSAIYTAVFKASE